MNQLKNAASLEKISSIFVSPAWGNTNLILYYFFISRLFLYLPGENFCSWYNKDAGGFIVVSCIQICPACIGSQDTRT